jgi:phage terminase large subunit
LTLDDVKDLENETDKYYYNVYTLGNWGILGNIIFTNWRVEDLSSMCNQFTNRRNGLDFGFSSDPAAMPVSHYDRKRKTIYIFNELYEAGLTNDLLADEIKVLIGHWQINDKGERICIDTDYVVCDSAEPKSIAELQKYGVRAGAAKKGKDSVLFGIQWLQQQTIVIDAKCINTKNEIMQYHWKEDKNGNAIRQPIDKNNHIIDGLRYAFEDDMLESWLI